ncbi:MAG: ATP-binding cassette domain-containing protein, partial [Paracoccaceae bacterium]|nr:ATP-binding cassette domain-containing protein [Paracoccaceae bacterium]
MIQAVEIRGLRKTFGDLAVLKGIDLDVAQGEVVVLVGSSGSGKSTLLRCINFMEKPTAGQVRVYGDLIGTEHGAQMRYREDELCQLRTRIG